MNFYHFFQKNIKTYHTVAVFLLVAFVSCNSVEKNPRITKTINANWTFNYFPETDLNKKNIDPVCDDKAWPAIALPHTWSTYETTGEIHPFIKYPSEKDDTYWWYGWGIYRKKFKLDESQKGK